jgi:hypothetical protein
MPPLLFWCWAVPNNEVNMKLYVPVRKDYVTNIFTIMTAQTYAVDKPEIVYVYRDVIAFFRKKDCQAWIDDFNRKLRYKVEMRIVTFTEVKKDGKRNQVQSLK